MITDILHGFPLPNCPYAGSYLPPDTSSSFKYHNPAISSTYYLLAVTFLVVSLLTIKKYNKVVIFNRSINHPSISNTEFIFCFLFVAIGFLIDAIRYTIDLPFKEPVYHTRNTSAPIFDQPYVVGPAVMDAWLLLGSSVSRSISLFFLCLALNQQIVHRSTSATQPVTPELSSSPQTPRNGDTDTEIATLPRRAPKVAVARLSTPYSSPNPSTLERAPLLRNAISNPSFNSRSQTYPGVSIGRPLHIIDNTGDNDLPLEAGPNDNLDGKWAIIHKLLALVYEYVNLYQIILFLILVTRLTILMVTTDPTRLTDIPLESVQTSNQYSWSIIQIIACLVQICPLIHLTFLVIRTPSPPMIARNRNDHRLQGPSSSLKFILLSGLLSIFIWLEPSIVYRVIDYAWHHPRHDLLCIVPPWWWIKNETGSYYSVQGIATHGWASIIDALQWISAIGLYCYFYFMKTEFTRNSEV